MARKFMIIGVVAILFVAAISGAAFLMVGNGRTAANINSDTTGKTTDNNTKTEERANLVVTSLSINKHDVLVNGAATVGVAIKNIGSASGQHQFNVTMDGAFVGSRNVTLAAGGSTSIDFTVSSSSTGNHTISVGKCSTYLDCFDRYNVGDSYVYNLTILDPGSGFYYSNMTWTVTAVDPTTWTQNITYSDPAFYSENSSVTMFTNSSWKTATDDLKFLGNESVSTVFGTKTLACYTYYEYIYVSDEMVLYNYTVYVDDSTNMKIMVDYTFYQSGDGWITGSMNMISTNMPWVLDIGD